ncbi:MAG: metalloregulator ArsR/SmtB family transcription factor [Burkholderiaceae bacterium]|jgi:DNA-binding transcriptional ArsR family regulator
MAKTRAAVAALSALSDETRRTLVEALRSGPLTVGELAARVTVTQSAVSQHLQILRGAKLVVEERAGTRHYYRLKAKTLGELRLYVDGLWEDALGAFTESGDSDKQR